MTISTIKTNFRKIAFSIRAHRLTLVIMLLAGCLVSALLLERLTSLPTRELSFAENQLAVMPIGWHGLIYDPFFLASKLLLSAGYYWFGQGGALVTRLSSAIIGAGAIICVALVVRAWHGGRIAILGFLLFACSAWTLHTSRYAGYDVNYLLALPLLLVTQLALHRSKRAFVPHIVLLLWGLLLYIPGMIWFVVTAAWWQRYELRDMWRAQAGWWRRILLGLCSIAALPLLIYYFVSNPAAIKLWAGLPDQFGSLSSFAHRLAGVPLHLFVHGPAIPEIWLGRVPVLDVFTLLITVLGVIYYVRHWRSARSQQLIGYAFLATIIIGLGGPATLSLIIPLAYLAAAAGLSYLLREWFKRFPANPIARTTGVAILSVAVITSCAYNLQSYFVAWPNDSITTHHFNQPSR